MDKSLQDSYLNQILEETQISLTEDQWEVMHEFWDFVKSEVDFPTFLLTGSAGTGKTFMIRIFTQLIKKSGYKVVLLAPTGRAAKVISRRTKRSAYTIHHHIYASKDDGWGRVNFTLKKNREPKATIYIIDEASMIGGDSEEGGRNNLLTDLVQYVFDAEIPHKLIFVGDPVQLPPIGLNYSPGLNPYVLTRELDLNLYEGELSEVKRQHVDSGILENAIAIRDVFVLDTGEIPQLVPSRDVQFLDTPYEALDTYIGYFEEGNPDRAVFITYSNYQAMKVNQAIRHNLWHTDALLIPSDLIMVVKNNYSWGEAKEGLPFLANGEMGTIRYVHEESKETLYGLNWIDAEIEFITTGGHTTLIPCKLVLDLLNNKQAQLTATQINQIAHARQGEYMGLAPSQMREAMRTDPYVNALQVKYGYAITGHKAQGGQWENVLVGFEPNYSNDYKAYIRWTYTVFTRAEARLFLLNCPFIDR